MKMKFNTKGLNTMKKILISFTAFALMLTGCEVDKSINDSPDGFNINDVDAHYFLNGAQLANVIVQVSHLNRISGMFSGQLVGYTSLYSNIYGYSLSTIESNGEWNSAYIGTITNVRHIRKLVPDDKLTVGIAKVIEANAIGTLALLMGDVPYSEIGDGTIEDPKFDGQKSVLTAVSTLLDEAIADLTASTSVSAGVKSYDIYFKGDKSKWIAAAYTLKARYALANKEYDVALTAANNGISSSSGDMLYIPRGLESDDQGDKNLFYTILAGSRSGDIGNDGSYLLKMLNPDDTLYRGNAKTNELARHNYYVINEKSASGNTGVAAQMEPQPIATYSENQLIIAEASARSSFASGLSALNTYRAWLAGGGRLNSAHDIAADYQYDAYVEADFASGGMENADGVTKEKALLREIIEESYVSGFGSWAPFNDHRRLRGAGETDLVVPFPLNTAAATQQVERIPWAYDEIISNTNMPSDDPGLYAKTAVNK
jgi:starch-binding outer membrane protein, SusD/RagB family